ncbi:ATP-binding protein [Streptomyces sp. NPDC059740]|uniref:ATP-binding protein n=1 Tax=Streptomyces sp. NPDC059740 TaxID=3346926 RepID=UPI003656AEED
MNDRCEAVEKARPPKFATAVRPTTATDADTVGEPAATPRLLSTGLPGCTRTWPREPRTAARARSLVRTALLAWGLDQAADDAVLVASELVGNAVRHTACRSLRFSITRESHCTVRIAVSDRSLSLPRRSSAGDGAACGRGLVLVGTLAERWGVDVRRWGKVVWAEVNAVAGAAVPPSP